MQLLLAAVALAAATCALAQPPERPNTPVFRSGPWFVVRTVRAGESVACAGFYRANRRVQLGKDSLVIQAADDVKSVAFGFDDHAMGALRPLSAGEKDAKSIALAGEDFAKLAASRKLRVEEVTAQGTVRHEFELNGLAAALENIHAGCPMPPQKPVRGKHRS